MYLLYLLSVLVHSGAGASPAKPPTISESHPSGHPSGFRSGYTQGHSAARKASCYSGLIPITINATTNRLALTEPPNQTTVTEIFQELFQANPQIVAQVVKEPVVTQETFNIESTLCLPADPTEGQKVDTVQVLNHGVGFDKSYWDIASGYSYVDAAAAAGYATLAYNRLGVGNSDHPDPLQVVQATTDVEIQHGIVQLLRSGGIRSQRFKHFIGTAHSYGSIVQLAQNAKYPGDVDGVVLTGLANNLASLPYAVLANNPAIASQNEPSKFGNLPTGYVVHDTPISVQIAFFRSPFFSQEIFDNQYAAKQTYTLGQQFTLALIYEPALTYTGPVDVVVGQNDFAFCRGDCTYPTDQAAATLKALYPAAGSGSQSFIVPQSGHSINAHFGAQAQFEQINNFLRSNNF